MVHRFAVLACAGCAFHAGAATQSDARADSPDAPPVTGHVRAIAVAGGKVSGGPHTDFPLLFAWSAPWLKARSSGGDVARDDGFDLRFSLDPGGGALLDHEVESYDPTTGDLVAWIRIPSLSTATVLYIHYGDPALMASTENPVGVWAGFAGVWHLSSNRDSTGKSSNAAELGTVAIAGKIASAREFGAAGDDIDAGAGAAIADVFATGGTVEAWIHPHGWGGNNVARIVDKQAPTGWVFEIEGTGGDLAFYQTAASANGYWNCPTGNVVLDQTRYVVAQYDKSTPLVAPAFFVEGAAVITNPTTFNPGGTPDSDALSVAHIGNNSGLSRTWDGWIDEVRLSAVVRSAGWIATTYQNAVDPAGFYTVGAEL